MIRNIITLESMRRPSVTPKDAGLAIPPRRPHESSISITISYIDDTMHGISLTPAGTTDIQSVPETEGEES